MDHLGNDSELHSTWWIPIPPSGEGFIRTQLQRMCTRCGWVETAINVVPPTTITTNTTIKYY